MNVFMKEDIVAHRLAKSHQALDDALFLLQNHRFLAVANRLYYAAFYIVTAYFAQQTILVKSHKGMSSKIHLELVVKGILTEDDESLYFKLMTAREDADYGDFLSLSEDEAKNLCSETQNFIQKIELLITINE